MHSARHTGTRATRTKATFAPPQLPTDAKEDTPLIRQRISEARRTNFLDLRNLSLRSIPLEALKLDSLTHLLLGNNQITLIPSDLNKTYPNLRVIDFSHNKITTVPSTLSDLCDMEILDIEGNLVNPTLPSAFGPLRTKVLIFQVPVELPENGVFDDDEIGVLRIEFQRFIYRLQALDDFKSKGLYLKRIRNQDEELCKYLIRRYGQPIHTESITETKKSRSSSDKVSRSTSRTRNKEDHNNCISQDSSLMTQVQITQNREECKFEEDDVDADDEQDDGDDDKTNSKGLKLQIEYARKDKEKNQKNYVKAGRKTKNLKATAATEDDY